MVRQVKGLAIPQILCWGKSDLERLEILYIFAYKLSIANKTELPQH